MNRPIPDESPYDSPTQYDVNLLIFPFDKARHTRQVQKGTLS
eukprot:CAMPEP_0169298780 /NCGR_PEP_ID=MMETSP1016-20121227/66702_1 /TAXON_ID=342587 /ORGANISM="Karlodinium micrum, Strain CCMP2283" /LENGTH=41 /DNA_ID= /DNA_START= /DNA_END= /DNA_ORIENTATION=